MGQRDDLRKLIDELNKQQRQLNNGNKKRSLKPNIGGIMNNFTFAKGLTFGGLFVALIATFLLVGYQVVEGNERAVVQDWQEGVLTDLWHDGTHFYIPLTTTPYVYNVGTDKFIMGNENLYSGKGADVVDYPAFTITTGGSGKEQPATFSVTLQYHLDPAKLVTLHNKARQNYEDQIIKPALTRIISDLATQKTVLDFYSGSGRVELQKNIEVAITEHPAMSEAGIVVETFVIDQIKLDENYVNEITGRQLATQKKLRAIEERKAAIENAKKVEAIAEADKFERLVKAEASKQEAIKAAEAEKQTSILKAEADRFRKEQDAKGLLAQGLAQAKVDNARKTSRYAGESGARQAAVEINQARVEMFKNFNVNGIIPEKAALTFINGVKGTVPTLDLNNSSK